jgi:hypothetical protein
VVEAENNNYQLINQVNISWKSRLNDPRFHNGRYIVEETALNLELSLHPNTSGRIIINYPGWRGNIDGFNNKHKKLAQYMQGEGLGAVVRGKGPGFPDFEGFAIDTQLKKMLEYSLNNAEYLCSSQNPELLLIGTSAGGGAVAAVASEYDAVSRILLMAPAINIGEEEVEKMGEFPGEVFIVIGRDDTVVGVDSGKYFLDLAKRASRKELFVIDDCDHNFSGSANGRLMSIAPFYAFAKTVRPNFPDKSGGIILY